MNWIYFAGTSAPTPIWAAIRSLNKSYFNNTTLYTNAANNYSFYFSDITTGSGNPSYCNTMCYPATTGYDFVTGLGDPLGLPSELTSSSVLTPQFNSTAPNTYNSNVNLSGTKDTSITSITVNGSNTGITYTSTSWSLNNFTLIPGNNNILIVGYNTGNGASTTNMIQIYRHRLSDINGDGQIDLSDFSIFALDWMHQGGSILNPLSDMNGDGTVNLSDFSIFATNWGH